jgi:hypothetical protein
MTGVWMNLTARLARLLRRNFRPNQVLQPCGAQVTIELTAALIGCILLLTLILKIFYWINQSIVDQQAAYQSTRATVSMANFTYTPKKLDMIR